MSGICGIINLKDMHIDKSLLIKMLKVIDHRGPDKQSVFVDDYIGLAHCLLNLRPEDKSKRPILNEDGSVFVVMDGSVFNYKKMKHELEMKGHRFYTDTHDEIVAHLYEDYGMNFPKYLDGDFTLALWDSNEKKLVLVKDIASHKNIYYTFVDGNFLFSSELKSLLVFPEVKRDLDYGSIREYLALLHIIHPNTMFSDIKRISPSCMMTIDKDGIRIRRYWNINLDKTIYGTEDFFIKRLFDLMNESVRKRMETCNYKKFGLFLSGGIDSTTILYFLNKFSEEPVDTYTIGVKEDMRYSRIAAEYFDTNHHEIIPDSKDMIKLASKSLWYIEMPRTVGFFLFSLTQMSRKKKYVFFGEGAEEVFFGREDHPILKKLGTLRSIIPQPLRNMTKLFKVIPNHMLQKIVTGFSSNIFEFYAKYRDPYTESENKTFFTPDILNSDIVNRIKLGVDMKQSKDFLKNFAYLDLDVWFLSQPYFCIRQDVANHFIDHDLLQFAFSIPSQIKVKNNVPRYLEKKMMKGKIPDEIVNRKWQAWDAQENWVGEQKDVILYFIEKLKDRKILNKNLGSLADFVEKNAFYPNDHKLWNLFTLEVFCEVFLDRDKIKEPSKLEI